jgi:hypothetical protein
LRESLPQGLHPLPTSDGLTALEPMKPRAGNDATSIPIAMECLVRESS